MLDFIWRDPLNTHTLIGALVWVVVFIGVAALLAAGIRRFTHRIESRLSDVTGLRFASAFAQVLVYVVAFILYAHLIPELRTLGTGLLAGVGIVSVVIGIAAQNTLGNLVSGLSLVLYRPFRVGDNVQLTASTGPLIATVEAVSLGHTALRNTEKHEIIVPNSVMANSIVIRLGSSGDPQNEPPDKQFAPEMNSSSRKENDS